MRIGLIFGCISIVACGSSNGTARDASHKNISAQNIQAGQGVELEMACTPTGPELCFNAIDDNCNGVIDEGCGVGTGVLQFTIAWGDSPADVDLIVTEPDGTRVYQDNRSSSSGLKLDKDCPGADGCHGQNIENTYYDGLEPAKGTYTVDVKLVDLNGAKSPVKVRVSCRVGAKTFGATIELSGEEKRTFKFEL